SIRTDEGGEYRKQIEELCKEHGIHHEETAPYTPEQNGVAERANRTICERIRAILADTKLPKELWAELACVIAHLKNRSLTTAQWKNALRGPLRQEACRLPSRRHRHEGIRPYAQKEDQKDGSSQFRRDYGPTR